MLVEAIKAARSNPAQVHRSRSKPANRYPRPDQPGENVQRPIWLVDIGIRETGYQASLAQLGLTAYTDEVIIQGGTKPFLGKIKFIDKGVIHCTHHHFTILL